MKKINILGIIGAFLDTLIKIAVVALVVMYTARFTKEAYDFGYRLFTEKPMAEAPGLDIKVTIPNGSNAMDIGKILEERGIIRDGKLFFVQVMISDYRGKLSAGTYTLNTSWDAETIMKTIAGDSTEGDGESDAGKSSETGQIPDGSGAIDSAEKTEGDGTDTGEASDTGAE